jgi:nucleoid-associated protein YgaU
VIAKKFYGAEEGNRRVNVQRIFEANRKILASEDMVYEGQKIVIPALPVAEKGKGESVLPGGLFERVSSIGRKGPAAAQKEQPGRYYVVKDGDNLWKIAEAQLGSGVRYKEISKLNSSVLASEHDLSIGMRLRLPVN